MSVQTLSQATKDVVLHYQNAGHALDDAWSAMSQRALAATQKRLSDVIGKVQMPLVKDGAKDKVIGLQSRAISGVERGCAWRSTQTRKLLDMTASALQRGIESTAKVAARVDAAVPGHVIDKVSQASLPVAHLSLFAAAAVESGAKRLGHRVTKSDGAEHTTDSKRKPAAKAKARQRTSKAG
jgi:hypothetical protein